MTYTIEQLKELMEGTTPGPWNFIPHITSNYAAKRGDFRFILVSRTAVPELIEELEASRKEIERLKGEIGQGVVREIAGDCGGLSGAVA